jgi:hypothetical protein
MKTPDDVARMLWLKACGLNGTLQRPPFHRQTLLSNQFLPHHVGITSMPSEPLAQPVLMQRAPEALRR